MSEGEETRERPPGDRRVQDEGRRLGPAELEELRGAAADVIAHAETLLGSRPEGGRPATDWGPLDQIWRSAHRIQRLLGRASDAADRDGPTGRIVA